MLSRRRSTDHSTLIPPQLNVVLEFVDGIKSQLADMDAKLDSLSSAIGAMHEDVKRLAGRPVLEVIEEWKERTIRN